MLITLSEQPYVRDANVTLFCKNAEQQEGTASLFKYAGDSALSKGVLWDKDLKKTAVPFPK